MAKYLFSFLFVFLMLSSLSLARVDDAKLKNDFGPNLTQVPFVLRFAFAEKFHKDWKESSYAERRTFLTEYEKNLASDKAQEKADAKAAAQEEKDRLKQKREAEREETNRLRAELAEQKAEQQDYDERQKEFNSMVTDQQKELQQMQQQSTQGNN